VNSGFGILECGVGEFGRSPEIGSYHLDRLLGLVPTFRKSPSGSRTAGKNTASEDKIATRIDSHHFSAFEKGFNLFIIESFCPALALER